MFSKKFQDDPDQREKEVQHHQQLSDEEVIQDFIEYNSVYGTEEETKPLLLALYANTK
jgi:hypothetical protein